MSSLSRRAFLKRLAFATDTARGGRTPHTLVCIFLRGGADTLNMVIPYANDAYYEVRPTLAIAKPGSEGRKASLKLNDFYAFHPVMKALVPFFHDGELAVVQGVGSDNTSGSHFEAQDQVEHGESFGKKLGGGWLGRHLRTRQGGMTPLSAVAIGKSLPEVLRGAPSASALTSVEEVKLTLPRGKSDSVTEALSKLYSTDIDVLGNAGKVTIDLLSKIEKVKRASPRNAGNVTYPETTFGNALREVSKLIKAEVGLEVACVDHDGWDTHFFQGAADGQQASNIEDLSNGLSALYKDIQKYKERVSIVVLTEFGRRIYENSSMGTDHGRGFALFALGGRVNGGRVFGSLPELKEQTNIFLGPSGLAVELDYRSVLSEVVRDLLGNNDLAGVFPNFKPQKIGIFHT
ncbi:DUF1501 domain-containing protein [Candidatus Obscuribacterales bacterium]|nr:DUF1501 domain-containing protein [Candidatus Obscuribacterales bacterium]